MHAFRQRLLKIIHGVFLATLRDVWWEIRNRSVTRVTVNLNSQSKAIRFQCKVAKLPDPTWKQDRNRAADVILRHVITDPDSKKNPLPDTTDGIFLRNLAILSHLSRQHPCGRSSVSPHCPSCPRRSTGKRKKNAIRHALSLDNCTFRDKWHGKFRIIRRGLSLSGKKFNTKSNKIKIHHKSSFIDNLTAIQLLIDRTNTILIARVRGFVR